MHLNRLSKTSLKRPAESCRYNLPPELQLVLACSRTRPRERDLAAQADLVAAGIDWQYFLALVEKHRVAPVIWKNLHAADHLNIPANVLTVLERIYQENAAHVLARAAELRNIVTLFEAEGIQHMVLKGLPIALEYYGDPTLRQAGDLDILVHVSDLHRAQQTLERAGYRKDRTEPSLTPVQGYIHRTFLTHHVIYQHQSTHGVLELHWRLFVNPYLLPADPFDPSRTRYVQFGSATLRLMSDEELLIYLCVHGDGHLWMWLKWQFDLPQFLDARPVLDWQKLMDRAHELGVIGSVRFGLFLAYHLFGADLPSEVVKEINADVSLRKRLEMVCSLLLVGKYLREKLNAYELMTGFRYMVRLRRGGRYQAHLWLSRCFSVNDWKILPLPDALFPLYLLLRPFLVMVRLWLRR